MHQNVFLKKRKSKLYKIFLNLVYYKALNHLKEKKTDHKQLGFLVRLNLPSKD
jgi:hypothetical protein